MVMDMVSKTPEIFFNEYLWNLFFRPKDVAKSIFESKMRLQKNCYLGRTMKFYGFGYGIYETI